MDKLDEKSAAKFINALVKSVQALCHGYLDFHNGIEIIGHINLSVDKESSLHYILEEKVCKSEENSTMFISNSFYAQKAELESKDKGCENASLGSKPAHRTDHADLKEMSKIYSLISADGPSPSSLEKSHSASTSSASETVSSSCKTVSSPAKRKASSDSDSIRSKTKASYVNPGSEKFISQSPHKSASVSSLEDAKPLVRELQGEKLSVSEDGLLLHSKRDVVNDLDVNLVGSVLEPVGERTSSDCSGRQDDSDGDLEVTFIKKEFLDESAYLPDNSCRFEYGRTQQRASSSGSMPDSSGYVDSHAHSAAASATYVPSARGLDVTTAHLYGPSTSSSHEPHHGSSFSTENKPNYSSQMFIPETHASLIDSKYEQPINKNHESTSDQSYPAGGQSHLPFDLSSYQASCQSVHFADSCYQGTNQPQSFLQPQAVVNSVPQPSHNTHTYHDMSQASVSQNDCISAAKPQHKKRWMCTMCNARYSYQADLKRHVRVRHMDKPRYRCHLCGMGFGLKDHYAGHMGAHNGVKNYECSWCSRKYFYRSDLMRHAKTCRHKNTGPQKL